MSAPSASGRGLSATELQQCVAELGTLVRGAEVVDAVPLVAGDDLLLVLRSGDGKLFVHVALGGGRARVVPTARRFQRHERATGPRADALLQLLAGARLDDVTLPAGERRLCLSFLAAAGRLDLQVELFGPRGLWALCDARGTVLELSRPVATAVRTIGHGDRYAPPPPRAEAVVPAHTGPDAAAPPRFAPPVLAAIDAHFMAQDLRAAADATRQALLVAADRALQRARKKADGLREQLAQSERAPALRAEADLMLAYLHTVARGAAAMTVPDPERDGASRTIELDPALPVRAQAEARYQRARRLEDGRAITQQRLATTDTELAALEPLAARLRDAAVAADELDALQAALRALGVKPAAPGGTPAAPPQKTRPQPKPRWRGENLRCFTSVEGYEVLVGRDNQQNDRLTLRIASGNDVWLHVGGGRPGSHVVVRLPKGKTASLDTLLDAGHLAVHFSKARGERSVDVVYTFAKHVRKPKGLPPGTVVPSHTKSLTVRLDEARLRRLLDSQPSEPGTD